MCFVYQLHEFTCYNGLKVDAVEAMCIFLKRFAYPCRYAELIPRFSKPEPQLCMIANQTMNIIYDTWHHLFTTFEQPWLDHPKLESFAEAIHLKGAALRNCWGFIDGTVRPISRPGRLRRVVYNGHKKVHSIKFQSVNCCTK